MKKIKVYHIITRLIIGGAQQNTIETCDYIKHERYEPHIVLGPETGPEGELISDAENRRIPMTILPELLRAPRPVKDSIALIKMVALFRREKPQIVHTHSSKAGILGRVAAKIARVPIIIHTVHGWGHPVFSSKIKRAVFKFLERVCEPFTDKLIVVSSLNADKGLQ
ncbi:MAG: glycosyltransferase family 4 protein, partial [Deltaproteobacteria bacterium]|nr:glycosyltransferase family 4 protein [Deltaproteobacteria bacterium]